MAYLKYILSRPWFSIKDFFSKYDHIHRKLRIWSHLLKKSLMENLIFRAMTITTIVIIINIHLSHFR